MLTSAERLPARASRVAGRGRLMLSLRRLVVRAEMFAELRAASAADRTWAARFADALDAALRDALDSPGAPAALDAVTARDARSRKTVTP